MAFLSKVGNLLRQTASKQISSEFGALKPSFFQAIRCMSSMSSSKYFIGGATKLHLLVALWLYFFVVRFLILYFSGLSNGTDDQSLKEAFAKYGDVVEGVLYLSHV